MAAPRTRATGKLIDITDKVTNNLDNKGETFFVTSWTGARKEAIETAWKEAKQAVGDPNYETHEDYQQWLNDVCSRVNYKLSTGKHWYRVRPRYVYLKINRERLHQLQKRKRELQNKPKEKTKNPLGLNSTFEAILEEVGEQTPSQAPIAA